MRSVFTVVLALSLWGRLDNLSQVVVNASIHDFVIGVVALFVTFSAGKSIWTRFVWFIVACFVMSVVEALIAIQVSKQGIDQGLLLKILIDQVRWCAEGLILVAISRKPFSAIGFGFSGDLK
jgi:hypothetical protein